MLPEARVSAVKRRHSVSRTDSRRLLRSIRRATRLLRG
jgi:hypothetical protein